MAMRVFPGSMGMDKPPPSALGRQATALNGWSGGLLWREELTLRGWNNETWMSSVYGRVNASGGSSSGGGGVGDDDWNDDDDVT